MMGHNHQHAGEPTEDSEVLAGTATKTNKHIKAYCEKMNKSLGWPMYSYANLKDSGIILKFGAGTFGIPIVLLSIFPLVFPFWLWVETIETGFPDLAIFGFQITFLPLQLIGYMMHLALCFLGGMFCKKFRLRHFGAARGVEIHRFIFWDVSVRVAVIPVGAGYFGWLAYVLLIRYP